MKKIIFCLISVLLFLALPTGCGPAIGQVAPTVPVPATGDSTDQISTVAASLSPALTSTPASTRTSTATETFVPSDTPTPSTTPTLTITLTPTVTLTPTFALPIFTVTQQAHCRYGPAKAYLHAGDLYPGDTGTVWGVDKMGRAWLYVKMDKYKYPCYVAKSVINVQGDLKTVVAAPPLNLPKSTLYGPIKRVTASRKGDDVVVEWAKVSMTEDDDRGYFIEGWFCQNGAYFWSAVAIPNQNITTYTFTDQSGCAHPSSAKIYVVEKHGYTAPVDIPWPAP